MRCAGREDPRKKVGVGGCERRWAQSRGEWAGARRTFLEGRVEAGRVEVVGERVERGGARRVEAEEGGGRRVEVVVGMGRRFVEFGLRVGSGGGGICEVLVACGFRIEVVVGRGGGGIEVGWFRF